MHDSLIEQQRDLYRLLLDLDNEARTDLKRSLQLALELIVGISGAAYGYIEVRCPSGEIVYNARHFIGEESVRDDISTGIIAEALDSGEPVLARSARSDPRFKTLEDVRREKIETVFCAPLYGSTTRGVLYLQGDFESEDDDIRFDAGSMAQHLSPLLDRLLPESVSPARHSTLASLRRQYQLSEVVGSSNALANALRSAMMAAPLLVNVLLTGDSGSGKTQLARVIHTNSDRQQHPFVEVNCAALPEALIENELFGSVKGAHSAASADSTGKVGVADRGTLFLDEVGALPLPAQAKLLQLLQSGEYYPLGSSRLKRSDARILFATNRDLEAAVRGGSFRADLYYRINTFPVHMPNLVERGDDIGELADYLCLMNCAKHRFPSLTITREGKRALQQQIWPGNVRELAHVIESACIRAAFEGLSVLGAEQLTKRHGQIDSAELDYMNQSFQEATLAFQASFLSEMLERHGGNISETARQLKISRSHLHHLINTLGLKMR